MMSEQNVVFPEHCRGIIDVTKPPYNLDPTGGRDCTETLNALIDSLLQIQLDGIETVRKKLEEAPGDVVLGFENRKIGGVISVIFPEKITLIPTLYFPNGTYLVSDTISYSHRNLHNICSNETVGGYELNRCIRFMGQSRDGVVIKLKDACKGFEFGNERPVISFMRGERSNVAMSNFLENLTIDVGRGNYGAVGLVFFANNNGAVRHVTIRSSDPEGGGAIGLAVLHEIVSGCYVRDLLVEGFNTGIKVTPCRNLAVFEDITLKGQRRYGFAIEQTITSIRNLTSENTVSALFVSGPAAHVILTDATLTSAGSIYGAIRIDAGFVFVRNVTTRGYASAIRRLWGETTIPDGTVDEYATHETFSLFGDKQKSMNLPVADLPDRMTQPDLTQWACVNDFGAAGDGETDDTDAIQAAMHAGKPVVWFQPGQYKINRPVFIPSTVNHIHGMYSDVVVGDDLRPMRDAGVFVIADLSETPLLIEKFMAGEQCYGFVRFFRHDCARTLYVRDAMSGCTGMYFNTQPGARVFFENVTACTGNSKYRQTPAYHFIGQTVWGHFMNPERSAHEIINDGGTFWLMGFKTEGGGPLIETYNGGFSEVLGGTASIGKNELFPIALNDHANVSIICSTNGYGSLQIFPVAIEERRNDQVRRLYAHQFPCRMPPFYVISLYTGYGHASDTAPSGKKIFTLY
jgi:hypothetical protein